MSKCEVIHIIRKWVLIVFTEDNDGHHMFRVQDSETITLDRIKEATVNFNIAIQDIFVGEGDSATL